MNPTVTDKHREAAMDVLGNSRLQVIEQILAKHFPEPCPNWHMMAAGRVCNIFYENNEADVSITDIGKIISKAYRGEI